ncbi:terpene cyclase, variant 2 [Taiwanofungus camphoratus]|uniref:Squalene synthase n=1 Tax=Taiwanofungus camphoratus TaxID=2696576 RepID=W0FEV9_TAICA|nr:squalene synthase [Taiwanofungus camphoratus]KAI0924477.1 terpene cyclase, variant 2 [Antrodia cinnamomea]KAI0954816.1 terpene cyclase, variant 2 [Antrodia cinnamomea]
MGALSMLVLLLTHPLEFRTLLQYKLWHESNRDITAPSELENSGWNRKSMRRCWELLDMTSRSFAGVIKELEGDLARIICLFYLVLRGLDTIEDDMTLPDEKKQPLLRSFHELTVTPGWTFNGSGPYEKDRQLLVEYAVVSEELNRVDTKYLDVIIDITQKMENGMADYAHRAATTGEVYVEKISDYDLYCHYVAGLVGEGLTRLWSASGKEAPWLGEQLELANSMGLMLQKTNIIRDYREDVEDRRFFWPREIWGREVYGAACGRPAFTKMEQMYQPGSEKQALWVLSGMVVDVLGHAVDSLDYLRLLRRQSVFNFCAIPQTMAMATLCLCFMNYEMFQRNIKIRKAEAASLIMRSTNPRDVAYIFRDYARKIHSKAVPEDPSFLQISVACGKIEQWCEHHYPSFVSVLHSPASGNTQQVFDKSDARTRIMEASEKRDRELQLRKRAKELSANGKMNGVNSSAHQLQEQGPSTKEIIMYIAAAFIIVFAVGLGGFWLLLKYFG